MNFRLPIAIAVTLALQTQASGREPNQSPAAQPFKIGVLDAWILRDANYAVPNDAKVFGVGVGTAKVSKVLAAAGKPTSMIDVAIDVLLVKVGKRLVLFDSGYGPAAANRLTASLKIAGFEPRQITDVLITHSHGDHVFGLITESKTRTFPNAMVRMTTKEWVWMRSQQQNRDVVTAISPKVNTFQPGSEIMKGVVAVDLKGHTPGHSGYEIRSGHARLLDVGDVVQSSIISLAKPDWIVGFDNDKDTSRVTRRSEISHLAKTGEMIFAPHFPYPGLGQIAPLGNGFVWKPF